MSYHSLALILLQSIFNVAICERNCRFCYLVEAEGYLIWKLWLARHIKHYQNEMGNQCNFNDFFDIAALYRAFIANYVAIPVKSKGSWTGGVKSSHIALNFWWCPLMFIEYIVFLWTKCHYHGGAIRFGFTQDINVAIFPLFATECDSSSMISTWLSLTFGKDLIKTDMYLTALYITKTFCSRRLYPG